MLLFQAVKGRLETMVKLEPSVVSFVNLFLLETVAQWQVKKPTLKFRFTVQAFLWRCVYTTQSFSLYVYCSCDVS